MNLPENINISTQVKLFFEQLSSGEMTHDMYYNRKAYARRNRQTQKVLDLVTAWELYNLSLKDTY